MPWSLQRSRRPKGWYYQAIWKDGGVGKGREAITLGYLSDEDAALAATRLETMPPPKDLVVSAWDRDEPCPPPSRVSMRFAALHHLTDTTEKDVDSILEQWGREEAVRLAASGAYGDMTLRQFRDEVWWPLRKSEATEATARSEKSYWLAILPALGHVRMRELDTIKWTAFLARRAKHGGTRGQPWSGRAQGIAENAYKQCLLYAVEIGAIGDVHVFRKIKGRNALTKEPSEPLTEEEVAAVLIAAPTEMHRALFAYAIGQGCRPSEAVVLNWADIDWESATIRVRGTKNTKADAVVPLLPLAEQHLRTYWESLDRPTEGRAFLWNGKPFKSWKNAWKTSCKTAGIKRRVYPYLARATFATALTTAGSTPSAVRAMMRHTTSSPILERAYIRLRTEEIRAGIKGMGAGADGE